MPTHRPPGESPARAAVAALALLALTLAPTALAADFAPVTDAERAFDAFPGDPTAPAVVLFERARLKLLDYPRDVFSLLEVEVRIKILDQQGAELFGEIRIPHSKLNRLSGFAGRTVLPDGEVMPVGEDAMFVEEASRSERRYVTKAAFPAVVPGAILDYRYSLRWDSLFHLEPWLFANEVPTLHSEITYIVPPGLGIQPWGREVGGVKLQAETERHSTGTHLKVWADNVPGVPDEPQRFPFLDLSSRFMAVPTEVVVSGGSIPLMNSWDSTCDILESNYQGQLRKKRKAHKLAKELAAGATTARQRVEAIYRFVRDEVQTEPSLGVIVGDGSLDRVVEDRRGSVAEKGLLLAEMLDEVGIEAQMVWAASRFEGRVDPELPNPWWFDRILVAVDLGGERVFVDPVERGLGIGRLEAAFEGMPALLYHPRKPQVIELPTSPPGDSLRRAVVELTVDGEGRASGSGTLRLTGHRATPVLRHAGDDELAEAWSEALGELLPGFDVSAVELDPSREDAAVVVSWQMTLRDEAVLGDELSLIPSRPVGPTRQPFALPPDKRRTPVQLDYAHRDEVELVITWAEGWEPEAVPATERYDGPAGSVACQVQVDRDARELRYSRSFQIDRVEFGAGAQYQVLRDLYAAAEKSDAQELVLAAR